jgi:hypothetical protein
LHTRRFNFQILLSFQALCVVGSSRYTQNGAWLSWKATPTEWGLDIEIDKFTTQNDWGLLDGEEDPETNGRLSDTTTKFQGLKLEAEGPKDIDVKIATTDKEQQQEDRLGDIVKNLMIRPKSRAGTSQYLAPSITAMMLSKEAEVGLSQPIVSW